MKIENKTNTRERRILIGMIVDRTVLGRISAKWQSGMFKSSWANLIASWCINYFNEYERAPLSHIESLFESWAENNQDKETIDIVEKFLSSLSDEYKRLKKESNSDYIIDLAGKYFNEVILEQLTDTIQGDIDTGKIDKAVSKVNTFHQIELGVGEGIDVFQDRVAIEEAFKDSEEVLIQYPGALGEFFGHSFEREGFVSFLAPEKRGKTWWLIDCAYRAALQRKKTVFFAAGDMGLKSMMRRFMIRAAKRPLYPTIIKYPISIEHDEELTTASVMTRKKEFTKSLSWQRALRASKFIINKKIKSKEAYLKLSCHPNSTLSVKNIQNILKGWEREEWIPDVVIIDYADILDMNYFGIEGRERINETWKQLRSLSQSYHCLVITATQSDTDSYTAETMNQSNFSDDKRKNAHVTACIGLNQTDEEKENGLMRLNFIVLREDEFISTKCIHVAGCPKIGNPAIKSSF